MHFICSVIIKFTSNAGCEDSKNYKINFGKVCQGMAFISTNIFLSVDQYFIRVYFTMRISCLSKRIH